MDAACAQRRRAGITTRHPLVWLIAKELRLQRMSFAVAAVWAAGMAAVMLRGYFDPEFPREAVVPLAFLCIATMPIVNGAIASAEERQLGTLEWQQLMPIAASTQWAVKAGVAYVLSFVLGLGLGAAALMIVSVRARTQDWTAAAFGVIFITSVSLYVSSLTSNVLRATVMSICAVIAGVFAVQWVSFTLMGAAAFRAFVRGDLAAAALVIVACALLLYFGYQNHRFAERPLVQVRHQSAWIAGLTVLLVILVR